MKSCVLSVFVLCILLSPLAVAQDANQRAIKAEDSMADVSPSLNPDIWLYTQQMRRYDDPQQAVRRKAEVRAQRRRARLAAMAWYGYSPSRPQASPTPFMGTYSPMWVGNGINPHAWYAVGYHPHTAVLIQHVKTIR